MSRQQFNAGMFGSKNEWELNKENVQPLKSGRNVTELNEVVQQQKRDSVIEKMSSITAHQAQLPSKPGSNPVKALGLWFMHLKWVEQHFRTGNCNTLKTALGCCIKTFRQEPSVFNTREWLYICQRFADCSENMGSVAIYERMYELNYCVAMPEFYLQWAWELERAGNYERVSYVLGLGLSKPQMDPESRFQLQEARSSFDLRVWRRLPDANAVIEADENEQTHMVFGYPRGIKVGSHVESTYDHENFTASGVVGQHSDASKGRFVVFEDYVDKEDVGSILSGRGRLALAEQTNNKKSMDTLVLWPRQGLSSTSSNTAESIFAQDASAQSATFKVHSNADSNQEGLVDVDKKEPITPCHSSSWHNSMKSSARCSKASGVVEKRMYCKARFYGNSGPEMQFEEWRAAKWRRENIQRQNQKSTAKVHVGHDIGRVSFDEPMAPPPPFRMNVHETSLSRHATDYGKMEHAYEERTDYELKAGITSSIDPFDSKTQLWLLGMVKKNLNTYTNFHLFRTAMPVVRVKREIDLGGETYIVTQLLGEGAFARTYQAILSDDASAGGSWCLKTVEKPRCMWEFYICEEVTRRIRSLHWSVDVVAEDDAGVLLIRDGYFFMDGSILVSELYSNGTLLDVVNTHRQQQVSSLHEMVVIYILVEMLHIVEALHTVRIIHGALKPDNFLLKRSPPILKQTGDLLDVASVFGNRIHCLVLADFGHSIDMALLSPGTQFRGRVETDCFQCPEMLDGREWSFQMDIFGIAATIYVLMFFDYMKMYYSNSDGRWCISASINRRWNVELWKEFYDSFLNIPNAWELSNLQVWRERLEQYLLDWLHNHVKEWNAEVEKFAHILGRMSL